MAFEYRINSGKISSKSVFCAVAAPALDDDAWSILDLFLGRWPFTYPKHVGYLRELQTELGEHKFYVLSGNPVSASTSWLYLDVSWLSCQSRHACRLPREPFADARPSLGPCGQLLPDLCFLL